MDRIMKISRKKKSMKCFGGMLRTENKRIFSIRHLLLTSLFLTLLLGADIVNNIAEWSALHNSGSKMYLYEIYQQISFTEGLFILFFIPVSFFTATNLCRDIQGKMIYYFASRSSTNAFILVKVIVGFCFTFSITFIIFSICTGTGFLTLDILDMDMFSYYMVEEEPYLDLLKASPFFYFLLRNLYISLVAATFTGIGMIITVMIPNIYVSVLSPFLSYMVFDRMLLIFGMNTFSSIISGSYRYFNKLYIDIIYKVLFFVVSYFIIGFVFYKLMKWRCYGEKA